MERVLKKAKKKISNITQDFNIFSNVVEDKAKLFFNKLKGKSPIPLSCLLQQYNISPGIFPRNIRYYEFDETKSKLVVYLTSPCEVKFSDSSMVRYATRVKATLLRGKLSNVEGMKTKILFWLKVTCVNFDYYKSNKVLFTVLRIKISRPKDVYDLPWYGMRVDKF
ncbi:uncharacterized protein At5g01610-like [Impatiens glandulifera]|uniref:uncharacterized protein At5g01610-like n=1 Tax=Impatiens glandulifera TaxID=253017 RepID=UPI001FB0BE70|nr:uncharacterized protein At5g01610-like [Impatiens glandulifera]